MSAVQEVINISGSHILAIIELGIKNLASSRNRKKLIAKHLERLYIIRTHLQLAKNITYRLLTKQDIGVLTTNYIYMEEVFKCHNTSCSLLDSFIPLLIKYLKKKQVRLL